MEAHLNIIYLCIPVVLWCRYTVCHGVPKSTTISVPALPILENTWVFLSLCQSLYIVPVCWARTARLVYSPPQMFGIAPQWHVVAILNHKSILSSEFLRTV